MKQFLIGLVGAVLAGVILLHIEYNVMGQDQEENDTGTEISAQEQYPTEEYYEGSEYYPTEEYYYEEPEYYPTEEYYYEEPERYPTEEYYYEEPEDYHTDEDYYEEPQSWEDDYQSSGLGGPEYMTITDYSIGTNGFYHKFEVTEDSFSFIEYDGLVIWGNFEFSRALTYEEEENLYHGGWLEDQYGNEIEDVSCWAYSENSEGIFAAELPRDLPHGSYTYTLLLDIRGGSSYESTAAFDY